MIDINSLLGKETIIKGLKRPNMILPYLLGRLFPESKWGPACWKDRKRFLEAREYNQRGPAGRRVWQRLPGVPPTLLGQLQQRYRLFIHQDSRTRRRQLPESKTLWERKK